MKEVIAIIQLLIAWLIYIMLSQFAYMFLRQMGLEHAVSVFAALGMMSPLFCALFLKVLDWYEEVS